MHIGIQLGIHISKEPHRHIIQANVTSFVQAYAHRCICTRVVVILKCKRALSTSIEHNPDGVQLSEPVARLLALTA